MRKEREEGPWKRAVRKAHEEAGGRNVSGKRREEGK